MVILVGLFLASLSSLRHMALFVVGAIPITVVCLEKVYEEIKNDKEALRRGKFFYTILVVVAIAIFVTDAGAMVWKIANHRYFEYPKEAIDYLMKNEIKGKLFGDYGWGGYLVWKMPNEKVFVDGRMPSWRWKAPKGESDWAFREYGKVLDGDFETIFKKYDVRVVVWRTFDEDQDSKKFEWLIKILGGGEAKKPLGKLLVEKGWHKVYGDNTAEVFIQGDI